MTVNLVNLRSAKNAVIGNPSAKVQLARDPKFVANLVDCLNYPGERAEVRIEAAHVVASLSYGSDDALLALLRAHAHHALLYALANFTKNDLPPLRAAFARALRALAASVADAVGPSQWGLGPTSTPESLDTLLPLLSDTTAQVTTSIAQLLASSIRMRHHRFCVSEWLPQAERTKTKEKDVRPRRGWEKILVGPGLGGWTVRQLVELVGSKDLKLQEAALGALAALAKDTTNVASALARPSTDRERNDFSCFKGDVNLMLNPASPLTSILNLAKSRSPDVQIAACLCAAHVLRALPRHQQDESSTRIVMNTVNRMIASPLSPADDLGTPHASTGATSSSTLGNLGQVTLSQRTRACFVLSQLVGLVTVLPLPPTPPSLIAEAESLAPGSGTGQGGGTAGAGATGRSRVYVPPPEDEAKSEEEEEWCEPEGRALLRECVRAMSRAVAVLKTNIVDSGLGVGVWRRCVKNGGMGGKGRCAGAGEGTSGSADGKDAGEGDKRVLGAGLAVVCNLVNDFSPLRSVLLDDGLVERLVEILGYDEPGLRVSALWAIKNLLYRSSLELKRRVMREVGWGRILGFLEDADVGIREQALNVLRNVTESERDIELVYVEVAEDVLLDRVADALKSSNDDIVLQAAYLLANLANDTEAPHQARILAHPKILPALHDALIASTITASSPSSSSSSSAPTPHVPHAHTHMYTPRAQARSPLVS
ncbi:hypothetical protein C0989_000741, partial [Termitomyces sp. Mn162]